MPLTLIVLILLILLLSLVGAALVVARLLALGGRPARGRAREAHRRDAAFAASRRPDRRRTGGHAASPGTGSDDPTLFLGAFAAALFAHPSSAPSDSAASSTVGWGGESGASSGAEFGSSSSDPGSGGSDSGSGSGGSDW